MKSNSVSVTFSKKIKIKKLRFVFLYLQGFYSTLLIMFYCTFTKISVYNRLKIKIKWVIPYTLKITANSKTVEIELIF